MYLLLESMQCRTCTNDICSQYLSCMLSIEIEGVEKIPQTPRNTSADHL